MKKSVSESISFLASLAILASLVFSLVIPVQTDVQKETRDAVQIVPAGEPDKAKVAANLMNLPLNFEVNQGQTDERVKFLARASGFSLFLTENEAVLKLRKKDGGKIVSSALAMQFEGANAGATIEGLDEQETKSNYFIGDDQTKWQRNITNYGKAVYREIYSGVDAVFYGDRTNFEYDFVVSPNANPDQIALNFKGARKVSIDDGCLIVDVKGETVKFGAPVSYQENENGRETVASRYVLKGENKVAFEVGEYDKSKTLVIDPKLIYATYIGGNTEFIDIVEGKGDSIAGIAIDTSGNAYITGNTDSTDFPFSSSAWATELELRGDDACLIGGPLLCGDAFVMKLNSTGTNFSYSTYIGGHNSDEGFAIAVDSSGRAYVTGGTDPFNAANFCIQPYLFPTKNAYQGLPCYGARADSDAFFTVLNSTGSDLEYSTYFGGIDEDQGNAIAIDSAGNAYISGESNSDNLPTKNGFQNDHGNNNSDVNDAFIAKFNPNESGNDSLLYASLLGGNGNDKAHGIAVDAAGNAYVVGETASNNLAVKAPGGAVLDLSFNGGASDGFIAKVDPTNAVGATSLVSLTYYGGAGLDVINAVAVEPATQRAHITGRTSSLTGFPLLNAFDVGLSGSADAFVAKLNADVTAQFYSSFLGGSSSDDGRAIDIDEANNVYVAGNTLSTNFPRINAFQSVNAGGGDAFVTKISAVAVATTPKILYSSLLGGAGNANATGREDANAIGLDKKGNVYIGGTTASPAFPTTEGVLKPASPGVTQFNTDGFMAKVESTFNDTIGVHRPSTNQFFLSNSNVSGVNNLTINFGQAGDIAIVGDWDGNGIDDPGVFRIVNGQGQFVIRKLTVIQNPNCPPSCFPIPTFVNFTITFGVPGDLPIAGDWNGDGIDSVGVFRSNGAGLQGTIFLTDENVANPPIDHQLGFGTDGDLPIAGDFDGLGEDGVGVFRPSTGQFFMTNDADIGTVDIAVFFGANGDLPTAGDFDGDGKDTIAVFRPSTAQFLLTNDNINIAQTTVFGQNGDRPVVGDWDGKPNQ